MSDPTVDGRPPSQVTTLELAPVATSAPWEDKEPIGDSPWAMRKRYAPAEAALRAVAGQHSVADGLWLMLFISATASLYAYLRGWPRLPLAETLAVALGVFAIDAPVRWAARRVSPRFPVILVGSWIAGIVLGYGLRAATHRFEWMVLMSVLATRPVFRLAWLAFAPGGRVLYTPEYQAAIAATPGFVLPAPVRWPSLQAEDRGRTAAIMAIALAVGLVVVFFVGWYVFKHRW